MAGFEEVWHGFDPARCAAVYDEDLEAMLEDRRLIRHLGKLRAIRANAAAMLEVAGEHGSFGAWLAGWPETEIVLLWEALAKRFSQLGGNSAPMFLRMVGKDTFVLTDSVVRALARWRAVEQAVRQGPSGRAAAQAVFNAWAIETAPPFVPAQPDPGAEHGLVLGASGGGRICLLRNAPPLPHLGAQCRHEKRSRSRSDRERCSGGAAPDFSGLCAYPATRPS